MGCTIHTFLFLVEGKEEDEGERGKERRSKGVERVWTDDDGLWLQEEREREREREG